MKRNHSSTVGSLHPMLFFAGVYMVALFFSIFICSAIFYSFNPSSKPAGESKIEKPIELSSQTINVASVKR